MSKWMSGVTREDNILNEHIRCCIGVASIVEKNRDNRLKLVKGMYVLFIY